MDVLLVRAGALGDILLLRLAVAALRTAGHGVRLAAPALPGSVLVGPNGADDLLPLDGPAVAALLAGDRPGGAGDDALRADAIVALTRSPDLIAALREYTPRLLARNPDPPPGIHASVWLAGAAADLGAAGGSVPPPLAFTADEQRAAEGLAARLPPRFLAIHPGSGSATKNWPAARFAALVEARAKGRPWLLVLGPAEDEAAERLRPLPGSVPADGLALRVLGALLARAGLCVGNDSGVTHLAAAAGAPTLALFGPTDPTSWAPIGPAVEAVRSADRTMEGLAVATVEAAAKRLLARVRDR